MSKKTYIKAVMIVFLLLIFTRIPSLVYGTATPIILVSTIVEGAFLIWGAVIISKKADNKAKVSNEDNVVNENNET